MKKNIKILLSFITAISVCMPAGAGDPGELTDATVQSYNDQLQELEIKRQQAINDLASIRNSKVEAGEEVGKYDEIIRLNTDKKKLVEGEIETLGKQIASTEQEIKDTEEALAFQEEAFYNRMASVYMEDDADVLELLFGAGDLVTFLSRVEYINAIIDYDREIINGLNENRKALKEDKERLELAQEKQQKRQEDFEKTISETEEILKAKLDYMEDLKTDESKFMNEYTYLKKSEEELNEKLTQYLADLAREQERKRKEEEERRRREEEERKKREEEERLRREEEERKRLEAEQYAADQWFEDYVFDEDYTYTDDYSYDSDYEYTDYSMYTYEGGALGWPIAFGTQYFISSEQGWRELYGMSDYHLGLDIACDNGTLVLAAEGGVVLISENHWSYGNYVLIDHGNGLSTLYAHMSSNAVSAGDTVEKGQNIGWVGLTGNTFGYHLHFEVREYGTVVNPRNYLVLP